MDLGIAVPTREDGRGVPCRKSSLRKPSIVLGHEVRKITVLTKAKMAPSWVQKLRPSDPQGSELLHQERGQSTLPVEKLSEFLFTREVLDRQDKILSILTSDKVFDKSQNYFDGRIERFQTALKRQKRLQQLSVQHNWSRDDYIMASELISEPGPYGLHVTMFLVRRSGPSITRPVKTKYGRRPPCEIKAHRSSTNCSWRKPRSTNILDATHKRSLGMAQT